MISDNESEGIAMMAKKERQSNIELLRILAIMGVIILHYNNPVIGGGIAYAQKGSLNFYILYGLESVFICAVDLFILISGYFMCESKRRNLWKPIELIVQVMLFNEAIYLMRAALHTVPFSIKSAVMALIPANYFVILYCVVFLISPFLNVLIEELSEKSFRTFVLLSVLLFSVVATVVDVLGELRGQEFKGLSTVGLYGSQWGYSIVNFILMYLIGAYLRKGKSKIVEWEIRKLCLCLIADVALIVVWARVNDKTGFFAERSAWEYCNPLIIFEAVIIFILFGRINLGINKVINGLAEGAFSVFLLHQVFIPHLQIKKFVTGNTILMLLHIHGCAIIIYLLCWCVHKVYHLITDPIFNRFSSKHMIMLDVESNTGD